MRTFHFAGSVGIRVTLGLPRLIEIFDAKKEPATSIMNLYMKKEHNNKKYCEKIAQEITEKRLKNFVTSVSLDLTNRRIKIKFKKLKKNEKNEILSKLKKRLKTYKIILRKSVLNIEPREKKLSVKDLQKLKKKLLDLCVAGIPGIRNTIVLKHGNDWIIRTFGSNLLKVINLDGIDIMRSYTNNIQEIANVLGIEAARTAIIRETRNTMKQQGLDIDERHVILVADIMTFSGRVRPIGRYGVAGMKPSVLTRAGFEETIKHLIKASVRQEEDKFDAIFDNVMINQQVPVGTGMFELVAKLGEE
jgi:DNA-directed RNA polymerase subunit A"